VKRGDTPRYDLEKNPLELWPGYPQVKKGNKLPGLKPGDKKEGFLVERGNLGRFSGGV